MFPRGLSLSLLLLAGCVPPSDGGDLDSEAPPSAHPGAAMQHATWLDLPETQLGDDDDAVGDDDDATDEPDDPTDWAWGEPDVPDGTIAVFRLECGLLLGPATKSYEKSGLLWEELRIEGQETVPRPELVSCFTEGNKTLDWSDDGTLWAEAGGLGHIAEPTSTAERWFGGVAPLERSAQACDDALTQLGMSWPVSFALELQSIVPPSP